MTPEQEADKREALYILVSRLQIARCVAETIHRLAGYCGDKLDENAVVMAAAKIQAIIKRAEATYEELDK